MASAGVWWYCSWISQSAWKKIINCFLCFQSSGVKMPWETSQLVHRTDECAHAPTRHRHAHTHTQANLWVQLHVSLSEVKRSINKRTTVSDAYLVQTRDHECWLNWASFQDVETDGEAGEKGWRESRHNERLKRSLTLSVVWKQPSRWVRRGNSERKEKNGLHED